MKQFPFEFPEISDDEARIIIYYTGLCHSDWMHARGLWGKNVTKFKIENTVGACLLREF